MCGSQRTAVEANLTSHLLEYLFFSTVYARRVGLGVSRSPAFSTYHLAVAVLGLQTHSVPYPSYMSSGE